MIRLKYIHMTDLKNTDKDRKKLNKLFCRFHLIQMKSELNDNVCLEDVIMLLEDIIMFYQVVADFKYNLECEIMVNWCCKTLNMEKIEL